jgi:MFS family permease
LGAGSLIIILYAGSMTGILAGILLSALASAAGNAVLTAWMGDNARRDAQGATFGWFAMIGDIGSALGPMLALFIYPLVGIAPAYWVGVILFALGAAWLNSSRLTSKRTSVSVSG